MKANKLIICAYHNLGCRCIEELLRQGVEIALIFTHEDSPTEEIWFDSVADLAERHGIPCLKSDINAPENVERLRDISPAFLFSFYYRNMIKPAVLGIPAHGALNLHGSYLPKYRGRVPVNWAVINGETETGATLHYMVDKPDAGDIVDQEKVEIAFTDTALDVFHKVTAAAVAVVSRSWPLLREGKAGRVRMKLTEGSYFGGRKPEDGRIDWNRSAVEIYNLVRGVTHPYPGAFTHLDGKKVTVWSARPVDGQGKSGCILSYSPMMVGTGSGLIEVISLQIEGEEEIAADQLVWNAEKQASFDSCQE